MASGHGVVKRFETVASCLTEKLTLLKSEPRDSSPDLSRDFHANELQELLSSSANFPVGNSAAD